MDVPRLPHQPRHDSFQAIATVLVVWQFTTCTTRRWSPPDIMSMITVWLTDAVAHFREDSSPSVPPIHVPVPAPPPPPFPQSCQVSSSAIDFGQFRLRPAFFFEFGQFDFGQFRLRPISTSANFDFGPSISANFWMLNFWTSKGGAPKGWRPRGWRPKPRKSGPRKVGPRRVEAPKGGTPKGGAQNFTLFFPSSRHNFLSSFFLLGSLRGILVVFEVPGP